MAYVPVEDTVQAELVFEWNGEIVENTLYFLKVGGWTTSGLTTLASSLAAWWIDELAVGLTSELLLTDVKVTDLSTQFAPSITYPVSPPEAGDILTDSVPNNVAVVVSFRTDARGRSFRGRNYVPGLPESSVNGSTLIDTIDTFFVNAYTALGDVETTNSCVHVVVSRETLGAPRVAGLATQVTSYQCDRIVRTQRRRLPR